MQKLGQVCLICVILALCLWSPGHQWTLNDAVAPSDSQLCLCSEPDPRSCSRDRDACWEWLWENGIRCWLLCKSPPHAVNHSKAARLVLCSSRGAWGWMSNVMLHRRRMGQWWCHQTLLPHWHSQTGQLKLSGPRTRAGVQPDIICGGSSSSSSRTRRGFLCDSWKDNRSQFEKTSVSISFIQQTELALVKVLLNIYICAVSNIHLENPPPLSFSLI